jgi:transposase-like protein
MDPAALTGLVNQVAKEALEAVALEAVAPEAAAQEIQGATQKVLETAVTVVQLTRPKFRQGQLFSYLSLVV